MSAKLDIQHGKRHWAVFFDYAIKGIDDFTNTDDKWYIIQEKLLEYKGRCVFSYGRWLDCVEFDTEEDLLYFKLKFN